MGFALETDDVLAHAAKKLEAKGFDLLVANDAARGARASRSPPTG